MKVPVGVSTVVLVVLIVLQSTLAVFQVLEQQVPWAGVVAACLAAVLGVLRTYQSVYRED